jgi:hypothetical protein
MLPPAHQPSPERDTIVGKVNSRFRMAGNWYRRTARLVRVNPEATDEFPTYEFMQGDQADAIAGSVVEREYGAEISFTETDGMVHLRVMPNGQLHLG